MKYNLWIGGVCNTFKTEKEGMEEYNKYKSLGYDDLVLEMRLSENSKFSFIMEGLDVVINRRKEKKNDR
jgi:hypothetical protein